MRIGRTKKVHENESEPVPMEKAIPQPIPGEKELVPVRRVPQKQPRRIV